MGILKTLFSSGDVIEKGLDAAINAGDKLVLTNEEKVDYHLRFLKAYEPFKIAQRFIALIVGIPFVSVWVLCAVTYFIGAFMTSPEVMSAALEVGGLNNDTLGTAFITIVGFYFAGGAIEGGVKAWKGDK